MSPEYGIGAEKSLANISSNSGIAEAGELFFSPDSWEAGLRMFAAVGSLASAVVGTPLIASIAPAQPENSVGGSA